MYVQYHIQENFEAGIPVWVPRKPSVLYSKVSFFIKQIINSFLLCEIYRKLEILNAYLWVKYTMAEEKHGDFIKNMKKLHKPWCAYLSNIWHVTIQNNKEPIYTWLKLSISVRDSYPGKNGLLSKFYYLFCREK